MELLLFMLEVEVVVHYLLLMVGTLKLVLEEQAEEEMVEKI